MLRAAVDFVRTALGFAIFVAISLVSSLVSVAQFVNSSPASGWFFAFLAVLMLLPGTFLVYYQERRRRESIESASQPEEPPPELSFGRAEIPKQSQQIHLLGSYFTGRVIRVPVINAQGAGEAKRVHARLTFMPDDPSGQFSPRNAAQGEWFGEGGPELEIDLPGNGRARYLDVVVILDGDYPHGYEWTTHSRAAGLNGYGISAVPFEVEIEVMGAGSVATFKNTLQIECGSGRIRADWEQRSPDDSTNWVPWSGGT